MTQKPAPVPGLSPWFLFCCGLNAEVAEVAEVVLAWQRVFALPQPYLGALGLPWQAQTPALQPGDTTSRLPDNPGLRLGHCHTSNQAEIAHLHLPAPQPGATTSGPPDNPGLRLYHCHTSNQG